MCGPAPTELLTNYNVTVWRPDKVVEIAVINSDVLGLAFDELEGSFAEDLLHLFLQVADAALPTVRLDQRFQRLVLNG